MNKKQKNIISILILYFLICISVDWWTIKTLPIIAYYGLFEKYPILQIPAKVLIWLKTNLIVFLEVLFWPAVIAGIILIYTSRDKKK